MNRKINTVIYLSHLHISSSLILISVLREVPVEYISHGRFSSLCRELQVQLLQVVDGRTSYLVPGSLVSV